MNFLYCILIGYFIGVISPSYIMSKLRGFDIRDKGSHNAGASNVAMVLGKSMGAICAVIDIAKAFFAVWLAQTLMPHFALAFPVAGVACILGHIFPFYMNFKGGKGLACLGGIILAFDWRVFFGNACIGARCRFDRQLHLHCSHHRLCNLSHRLRSDHKKHLGQSHLASFGTCYSL